MVNSEMPRQHRPFFMWVVFFGLLIFALFNALRLYGALHSWQYLQAMGVRPGAGYIALTGGVFAAGFLAALVSLLLRLRPATWITRVVVLLYAVWYWVDRLLLSRSMVETANTLYMVFATGVLVLFVLAALAAYREIA